MLNVLVACEYSGTVRDAFNKVGFNATSCDLLPSRTKGNHYQGNVKDIINNNWDILIGFPPCTYLCNSGVHHLHKDWTRWKKLNDGCNFFLFLLNSKIPHICIENPIPHKYAVNNKFYPIGKYTQTIQPYEFGHPESKKTCLWLKNLPLLKKTNILKKPEKGYWENQTPSGNNNLPPSKKRALLRAKTYEGIAAAMASQWSEFLQNQKRYKDRFIK